GFLYAWGSLLVIGTGAAAAVGYTFASYTAALFHWPAQSILPIAATAIALFSVVNLFGVQFGAWTQNVLVVAKLGAVVLVIVAGLWLAPSGSGAATCAGCAVPVPPVGLLATLTAVGGALVPVLFTYGGWQQTNYVAEEIIDPERNLPRALL